MEFVFSYEVSLLVSEANKDTQLRQAPHHEIRPQKNKKKLEQWAGKWRFNIIHKKAQQCFIQKSEILEWGESTYRMHTLTAKTI